MKIERILITLVIGIAIGFLLTRCNQETIEVEKLIYNYKTDTIIQKIPFQVLDTLIEYAPPKTIIQYVDTGSYKYITVEKVDSNLIVQIEKLNKEITIHENYLKKYPTASKLVELKLDYSTLSLTLLDIDAKIKTSIYPIDLQHYKLQYINDSLRFKDIIIDKPKPKIKFNGDIYTGIMYEFLSRTPLANVSYVTKYRNILFQLDPAISIETTPKLYIYLKAQYKIF